MTIDLNCDMGESFGRYSLGNDFKILEYVSSCNIACGFHAGDPKIIIKTIKEALRQQVKIGAHPSYPDLQGFGRRKMMIEEEELTPILQYQIAAVHKLIEINGGKMNHVKPHGALYNQAFTDKVVSKSIISALEPWEDNVSLYAQYKSELKSMAEAGNIIVKSEGFVDRRYDVNLNLMSRDRPKALFNDLDDMIGQAVNMIKNHFVEHSGGVTEIEVDTLCIHGDHPKAFEIVKTLTEVLHQEGVKIE